MTTEDFVAWSNARHEKHWELFDGVPLMQQSQTWGHADLKGRIYVAFLNAIAQAGLSLSVGVNGIVIKIDAQTVFEPDVVVFAGDMHRKSIIAPHPLIVTEVSSPSTVRKDLTTKLAGYFKAATIEHYLIADWEESEIVHYRRNGAGIAPPETLRQGVISLDPPGLRLDIGKLFE